MIADVSTGGIVPLDVTIIAVESCDYAPPLHF